MEANARAIEPGYDLMTDDQKAKVRKEVETALALLPTHGDGKWKSKILVRDAIADIDAAAGADAARRTST